MTNGFCVTSTCSRIARATIVRRGSINFSMAFPAMSLVLLMTVWSLQFPDVGTWEPIDWQPVFTEPEDLQLTQSTAAFFTHSSRHFDPLSLTGPAVNRVAATMKANGLPTIYLHDRYNSSNPAWMYLYNDLQPTAFVGSDVGHIDIDLTDLQHAISVGGYFGQCQRSTVGDLIRCWRRDAPERDFRITQVLDAVFCVGEYMKWEDPFRPAVRAHFYDNLKKRHPKSSIPVSRIVARIRDQDVAIDFLLRQIPTLPRDANVVVDFFGSYEILQRADDDAPTLYLAWRYSDRFLRVPKQLPDKDQLGDRSQTQPTRTRIIRRFR